MERVGYYHPFTLAAMGSDEGKAIASALALCGDDPNEAAIILTASYYQARHILDHRQDATAAVTAALIERDLDRNDIVRLLGPLPAASCTRNIPREPEGSVSGISKRPTVACLGAMMDGRPFAVGWIHYLAPPRLVWLDTQGRLRGYPDP
jgi:hypothetical protein